MTDTTLQVEAIAQLYKSIESNIDEELIRNMPDRALFALLSTLLRQFIDRQGYLNEGGSEAYSMLLKLKKEYGV